MLHAAHEPKCSVEIRYWNSRAGREKFEELVARLVPNAPAASDPLMISALRAAAPPNMIIADDREVRNNVLIAAHQVAERMLMARKQAWQHKDFINLPQPARMVSRSSSDRNQAESLLPLASNPHYSRWLATVRELS